MRASVAWWCLSAVLTASVAAAQGPPAAFDASGAEARAVAFLVREVPR
jgi:hypothetical protein